ncbi:MAG TPA: NAD(P)/FAD-dependent oxidoreductase [Steroidobacteraceae bacterium]|nr:NAD(P)/FAD-dependent oxidoreductase [Steroidobacteraceae bacterium]
MTTDVDVAIVGGGAAGIGAARRLAQSNYSTVLFEAGPRLGGRAWTHEVSGLHLDLGCAWFHSAERNSWIRIAEAAGIPIDRRPAQWGNQYRDLGFPKAERVKAGEAFAAWMHRLESSPSASDCAADALAPECEWNDYIRTIVGFISGGDPGQLSIADYLAYDQSSSENNWRVPSGYGSLVANSFPSRVPFHLATPVESIALEASGVTLATPAGTVRARAAILTVSTAVLAGDVLKLPAELTPWMEAASCLPLGRNEKLFFEIVGDAPFADESQLLGNPRQRTASYYIRPLGSRVIECFFGGEGARFLEESGHAAGFDFALGQLSALFGAGIRGSLRPLIGTRWSEAKHIGGGYSYALPGHATARTALARPFDERLFFAGEATSAGDFSTAHGAHDSGVRAAEEAIAAILRAP